MTTKTRLAANLVTALEVAIMIALFVTFVGCGEKKPQPETAAVVVASQPPAPVPMPPAMVERATDVVVVPEPPKEVTYEEAEAAYKEARYAEAVDLFTRYTERKASNPWGHYMLGLSAWKAGQLAPAEAAFRQALQLDALHAKSWINLSRVLLDDGRPEEALIALDEAFVIDPVSNVAFRLQGRAHHQLGQVEEAEASYREALQLDSQDAWAMNNLALLFIEQGRFEAALPVLALAVETRTDVPLFYNNLGMALERTGHFHAAYAAYEKAVALDDSYEKAADNLARVETVEEEVGLMPVDLTALAQRFFEEIERRRADVVSEAQPLDGTASSPEETLAPAVTIVIAADTTGREPKR